MRNLGHYWRAKAKLLSIFTFDDGMIVDVNDAQQDKACYEITLQEVDMCAVPTVPNVVINCGDRSILPFVARLVWDGKRPRIHPIGIL